jgi:hypothetical protein
MNGVTKFYLSLVIVLLVGFYYSDVSLETKLGWSMVFTILYTVFCIISGEYLNDDNQIKYWSIIYWIREFHKWLNKIDD